MSSKLFDEVRALIAEIEQAQPADTQELEAFRVQYLGSKNSIKPFFAEMRHVPGEERKAYGLLLNEAKQKAESKFQALQQSLEDQQGKLSIWHWGDNKTVLFDESELGMPPARDSSTPAAADDLVRQPTSP